MTALQAWIFLIAFFAAPLCHVALSPRGGPYRAPEGSKCPVSPRIGWLIIVLFLGAIGWLMYMRGTSSARRHSASAPQSSVQD
ncbi:MAG: hypothetical protein AAF220_03890 [Pseudomonadota bacterium]